MALPAQLLSVQLCPHPTCHQPTAAAVPSPSRSSGECPRRAGPAETGYRLLPSSPLHQTTPCTSAGAGAPPGQETGLELQVRQGQGAQRVETYGKPNPSSLKHDLTSTKTAVKVRVETRNTLKYAAFITPNVDNFSCFAI